MYTPLENAPQGSAAWLAARAKHFCASEAAAALGMSKYTTRDELLRQKATGLTEEVSPAKQRIFDAGHEAEALARPIAEGIAGTEFFPVVATREVDGLPLLASFDGIDVLDDLIWENKLLNQSLVQQVQAGDLEPHYWLQLEHQLLVSGASRALFTTSDGTPEGTHPLWYESKPERRAQLIAGWKQFAADLAAWTPPEAKPAPVVGKTPDNLPALLIQVTGAVTASNLPEFKAHALEVFKGINRTLTTDQDFATAESTVKWCADVESRLAAAKEHALSQTATIDALFKTIDDISAEARRTRLELDKLVKARKEEIRGEIVAGGITALREHIAQLNAAMPADYMPQVPADFAGAIKGKRTVESLRSAVNDELARAKIEASNIATRIHANVKTLEASGLVVPDAATLVLKAPDDLAAIIATRKAAEQQRLEAERERIRQEEALKLQREAQAKAEADARAAAQAELALAKQNPEGQELSPAAQALHEQEGRENFARAHRRIVVSEPAPANVVPMRAAPAPAERTGTPTLRIGTIKERLQHMSVTAEDLRALGFEPAGRERAAPLYHDDDFPAICEAIAAQALEAKAQFLRDLAVVAA
ncbi:YqaJ viral recombinase family protein [Acidovorax sp. IB03]|uniref:YqaJ viral recombinase family protein n=1 Tax=Acidovorax sp. IB03 TaxID=2779366 RepID=UPI0018E86050|nr:YqaJ viral recombinase family protein [Acidovorax sp. IB03]MBJ2162906.1 YqaJ viral recombinase family protein [Acidovorax sp. IB03]